MTLLAKAWHVGTRFDTRALEAGAVLAHAPLTVSAGTTGYAMLFRFGVVVMVGMSAAEQAAFLSRIEPFVTGPVSRTEGEEAAIRIAPGETEKVDGESRVVLAEAGLDRLQVVAHALAKSTLLGYYETTVGSAFDQVEQLLDQLRRGAQPRQGKEVVRQIGEALAMLTRTVGRAEVTEKPEITWDRPDLDSLYQRLAAEYELRDRDLALSRKLELVWRAAGTYLDLAKHRQALRVEWYIVLLIVLEILLGLWDRLA